VNSVVDAVEVKTTSVDPTANFASLSGATGVGAVTLSVPAAAALCGLGVVGASGSSVDVQATDNPRRTARPATLKICRDMYSSKRNFLNRAVATLYRDRTTLQALEFDDPVTSRRIDPKLP
jgi:hypothetical protein